MAEIIEIIWTNKSRYDLKLIYNFLSETINESIAFDTVTKLIEKVEILYDYPNAGQKEPKFEKLIRDYRRLVEKNYKIVYHQREKVIYINRVFDSRQEPAKLRIK